MGQIRLPNCNCICLNCDKSLPVGRKYCNVKCQTEKRRRDSIYDWLQNPSNYEKPAYFMKIWLKEKNGNKCHECGWNTINKHSSRIPLEMHHIDGNWKNNKPDNITLLCPNCHSLTSTYRIGNKGNGRRWARKYYHNSKQLLVAETDQQQTSNL